MFQNIAQYFGQKKSALFEKGEGGLYAVNEVKPELSNSRLLFHTWHESPYIIIYRYCGVYIDITNWIRYATESNQNKDATDFQMYIIEIYGKMVSDFKLICAIFSTGQKLLKLNQRQM